MTRSSYNASNLLQHILNADFTRQIGAEPFQRTPGLPQRLQTSSPQHPRRYPQNRSFPKTGMGESELFEKYQRNEKVSALSLMTIFKGYRLGKSEMSPKHCAQRVSARAWSAS